MMRLRQKNIRIHRELGEICSGEHCYEFRSMGADEEGYRCNFSLG
jgi:hypothetical protein